MSRIKEKIITFFKKYGIFLILSLIILLLGIGWGKSIGENKVLKERERQAKERIKELDLLIKESEKKAEEYYNKGLYYQDLANKSNKDSKKVEDKIKDIKTKKNEELSSIDNLSKDSIAILFAREAERYLRGKN